MQRHINNIFKVVNKFDFVYCKLLYSFSSKKIYVHQDLFDYYYYMTDGEKTITSLSKYFNPLSYADILESDLKLLSFETFFYMEKTKVAKRIYKYILKGCVPLNDCILHILKWGERNSAIFL